VAGLGASSRAGADDARLGGTGPIVFNIEGSVIGNLSLAPVLGDLSVFRDRALSGGQPELAALIKDLVERIPRAAQLSPEEQQEALELTNTLSEEMRKGPDRRLRATIRAVASILGPILTWAAELATVWQAILPYLPAIGK
jgi:hypothetical protein